MLIECPNCAAAFQVPERLLIDRARPLRCGQCRAVFPMPDPRAPEPMTRQERDPPPAAEPPVAPAPLPAAAGPEAPLAEPANDASTRLLRAAWAASIALLVGGGLAAIIKRDALMEAWPPAARLFAALGLA
ncbi:MAG: zinc-ribbon domain-containing protein [Roseomonas sp.]|nr:zinc-ribbon domain-containing protein [Roseomonas sp.]MCA3378613.1 zinc-ribbon domain-containing protein [Roseomonas sp.]